MPIGTFMPGIIGEQLFEGEPIGPASPLPGRGGAPNAIDFFRQLQGGDQRIDPMSVMQLIQFLKSIPASPVSAPPSSTGINSLGTTGAGIGFNRFLGRGVKG